MTKRCTVAPERGSGMLLHRGGEGEAERTAKIGRMLPAFFLLSAVLLSLAPQARGETAPAAFTDVAILRGERKMASFRVEMVAGREEMKRGLSGREDLADDGGMLFALEPRASHAFWMKGMKFSLDVFVFDQAGKIIAIFESLPPCEDCRIYAAPEGAAYVLEAKAGSALRFGIRVGDSLDLSGLRQGR